ncbi:MAG: SAM-dependent methyltransferase, partial [Bacteroidales bacterium]|nr:SAM-dependent methyltransferase [Bacteroidales bacterium]
MHLSPALQEAYTREQLTARQAQRQAQFIAWGPMVFQVSRLMVKFGILDLLRDNIDGLTQAEIVKATGLSDYAVKVLLEASLSIGT